MIRIYASIAAILLCTAPARAQEIAPGKNAAPAPVRSYALATAHIIEAEHFYFDDTGEIEISPSAQESKNHQRTIAASRNVIEFY